MGLDSVQLVMDIEDTFNIRIPDKECEQINTVEDFSNIVKKYIVLYPNSTCLTQHAFYKLRRSFEMIGDSRNEVLPNSTIRTLLPSSDLQLWWNILETELEIESKIKIPSLHKTDFDENLNSHVTFLGLPIWKRAKPITQNSVKTFIDWILAMNHANFINPLKVKNRYEIARVIIGIIHETCAVPIDEIFLNSEICNDFGID
jgi:hypothetical protein